MARAMSSAELRAMVELQRAEEVLSVAQLRRDETAQRFYVVCKREADRRREDQRAWDRRQRLRLVQDACGQVAM
jgi:hypothetical protein